MNKYKLLEAELKQYNILIHEIPLDNNDCFTVKINDRYFIAVNKNKNFNEIDKYWIINHEIEHIKNNTFYTYDSNKNQISKYETITNQKLIDKLSLDKKVITMLLNNCESEEIRDKLELSKEILIEIQNKISRDLLLFYHQVLKEAKKYEK